MEQVKINPSGSAVSFNIRYKSKSAENINAVYTYRLWDATTNTVVAKNVGNNLNDQDDTYWLPTPTAVNDGRIIELHSTLKNNDDNVTPLRIEIEICQGGKTVKIIKEERNIPGAEVATSQIFIRLKTT